MKAFALTYGLVFLLIGILGFFPGLLAPPDPDTGVLVEGFHGKLLGLFPVNWVHNLVHAAFGIWGLLAARDWFAARGYARIVAIIYGVLTIMGLIPITIINTTFGLVPLYGNDVWLHLILAAVAAYFGWAVKPPARTAPV